MTTVFDRVRRIIAEHLEVPWEAIKSTDSLCEDLGFDKQDLAFIDVQIEEEFSSEDVALSILDEDDEKIKTVGDYVEWVKTQGINDN